MKSSQASPPLLVDISPALINQTAVGRLVLDTVRCFEGHCRVRSFGREMPSEGFKTENFAAQARTLRFWLRHPHMGQVRQHLLRPARGRKVIHMDPLYVLFHSPEELENAFVFVHDLTPLTRPDWHDPKVGKLYRRAFEQIAASRAEIATISESTARDLRVNLGVSVDRIRTPMFYLANVPSAKRYVKTERFLLFVGSLELRKNLLGLIEGYGLSRLHEQGVRLKVVGSDAHGSWAIRDRAQSTPGVELLGFVSAEELDRLYGECEAFVYPSFWEGFGVPLLEAMARGIPCVSTDSGASPEVGGDAPIYVDPYDSHSIARGIREVLDLSAAEKTRRVELGFAQTRKFGKDVFFDQLKGWLWH